MREDLPLAGRLSGAPCHPPDTPIPAPETSVTIEAIVASIEIEHEVAISYTPRWALPALLSFFSDFDLRSAAAPLTRPLMLPGG
jgi:hypothetical protein